MKKINRVLITGVAGFIGSNLLDYIVEHTDWKVTGVDDLSTGAKENIRHLLDDSLFLAARWQAAGACRIRMLESERHSQVRQREEAAIRPRQQGRKTPEIHCRAGQLPLPNKPYFIRCPRLNRQRADRDGFDRFGRWDMAAQPCGRCKAKDHDHQRRKAPADSPHAEGSTNNSGSSRASCHLIDQWRCGPVARPEAPIRPICWPWATCSPSPTSIEDRCRKALLSPCP